MPASILLLIAHRGVKSKVLHWMYTLGGPGLILLGLVDNSVVPVTGSMDVATVLLCAQRKGWWPYYAVMATIGAVIGGYLTYRLARGEAKGNLRKIVSQVQMNRVKALFEKWGFGAIVVPALLPPPFPMLPFVIAAGATQYPRNKFLWAISLGRGARYAILGLLGYLYGRWILGVIKQHVYLIVGVGTALILLSVVMAILRLRYQSAHAH